ncbi:MAG: hypothetical protein SVR81_11575, partial [Chloroflexota bacterium]|nr:hypothetical protein [Chloroflexota bacterium]
MIALIPALNYHSLTEQVPRLSFFVLPQGARRPQIDHPPIKIIWLSEKPYQAGIREAPIDQAQIKIYSPEKTLVDCFKFRNKLGLDAAIGALKCSFEKPGKEQDLNTLMGFARLNLTALCTKEISTPRRSAFLFSAGRGGFEPPVELSPNNHLAGGPN